MKLQYALTLLLLPLHAFAENITCDALFLDVDTEQPIPGYIVSMNMTDTSITLTGDDQKEYAYSIDFDASSTTERTYVAKTGNLPINKTPMNQQVAVMLMSHDQNMSNYTDEPELDGILTDSRLDTYVLKNCRGN